MFCILRFRNINFSDGNLKSMNLKIFISILIFNLQILLASNRTPLHDAAKKGHTEIILALIKKGAKINAQDSFNLTPLHLAAENGHTQAVLTLMNNDADINTQDFKGWTPLNLAVANNRTQAALALINNGANIEIQNSNGNTPLHLAAVQGQNTIISALFAKNINPFIANKHKNKAIDLAKNASIRNMLAEYSAEYEIRVKNQQSAKTRWDDLFMYGKDSKFL